ncbi:MAG: endonuclease SmrB [Sodalis sp. (in: enterobacteria)]|uniref:endonuclease SmrB n=1 Tax=Sodalis sp. (in: enterobacteria) TaxID=1898979 RepID=UPI0039E3444E
MKKRFTLAEDDLLLFRQTVVGAKPLPQDRVRPSPPRRTKTALPPRRLIQEQVDASFYFSDEFQPLLQEEGPPGYVRPDVSPYEVKKLRRGDLRQSCFWICTGSRRRRQNRNWARSSPPAGVNMYIAPCVMHGHGKHILKQQTPLWLVQHPDVKGFHQAPKEFGGSAALLILVELVS